MWPIRDVNPGGSRGGRVFQYLDISCNVAKVDRMNDPIISPKIKSGGKHKEKRKLGCLLAVLSFHQTCEA